MDSETMTTVDWQHWVERFDRMQDRYLIARKQRFALIVHAIRQALGEPKRVLDLGCGTGSLAMPILQAFPACRVVGIDLDTTLLTMAQQRLSKLGGRFEPLCADLRSSDWMCAAGADFDAAVSATALHWLSAEHLAQLYQRLARVLQPGGILLNADHVASEFADIQASWQLEKQRYVQSPEHQGADTWRGFWEALASTLGRDGRTMGSAAVGEWEGVEEGMPLAWHFARLREAGFVDTQCLWRSHGDAIYGALLGQEQGM